MSRECQIKFYCTLLGQALILIIRLQTQFCLLYLYSLIISIKKLILCTLCAIVYREMPGFLGLPYRTVFVRGRCLSAPAAIMTLLPVTLAFIRESFLPFLFLHVFGNTFYRLRVWVFSLVNNENPGFMGNESSHTSKRYELKDKNKNYDIDGGVELLLEGCIFALLTTTLDRYIFLHWDLHGDAFDVSIAMAFVVERLFHVLLLNFFICWIF